MCIGVAVNVAVNVAVKPTVWYLLVLETGAKRLEARRAAHVSIPVVLHGDWQRKNPAGTLYSSV